MMDIFDENLSTTLITIIIAVIGGGFSLRLVNAPVYRSFVETARNFFGWFSSGVGTALALSFLYDYMTFFVSLEPNDKISNELIQLLNKYFYFCAIMISILLFVGFIILIFLLIEYIFIRIK